MRTNVDGCLFILEDFDNIKNIDLDVLNIAGVDKGCYLFDKLHENFDSMLTGQRQVNSCNGVVFFEFDFLKFLLDFLINGMGNCVFRQEKQ